MNQTAALKLNLAEAAKVTEASYRRFEVESFASGGAFVWRVSFALQADAGALPYVAPTPYAWAVALDAYLRTDIDSASP